MPNVATFLTSSRSTNRRVRLVAIVTAAIAVSGATAAAIDRVASPSPATVVAVGDGRAVDRPSMPAASGSIDLPRVADATGSRASAQAVVGASAPSPPAAVSMPNGSPLAVARPRVGPASGGTAPPTTPSAAPPTAVPTAEAATPAAPTNERVATGCATAGPSGRAEHLRSYNDVDRRFDVWRPTGDRAPSGVVLLFHGWSGDRARITETTDLPARAVAAGWLVVVPQGWGSPTRWALPGRIEGPDDVAFVAALLRDVRAEHCLSPGAPAVLAGYSNGAGFASEFACAVPAGVVAAIVTVAGVGLSPGCDRPGLPVTIVHDRGDSVVPFGGGPILGGMFDALAVEDVVATWSGGGASVDAHLLTGHDHEWPLLATELVLQALAARTADRVEN